MKYLNTGLVCEQSGLSCVELPKICIPVYREVVKEMAEVIKDSQMRDVLLSFYRDRCTDSFQENRCCPQESGIYV